MAWDLLPLIFAATMVAVSAPAAAQSDSKIGFVNTERILRDAAPAVRAQKKIETEFAKRDQELTRTAEQFKRLQDEFEKNGVTMTEAQRRNKQREISEFDVQFQRKRREFQEDLNQRRNEELAQVVEQANRVIRQVAEAEKYDVIFQAAVFASPRIDITDKVIKALEGKPPAR